MASISTSSSASVSRKAAAAAALVAALVLGAGAVPQTARPVFFPDDPIQVDDDMARDASRAVEIDDANGYDFTINMFGHPGERDTRRAMNVNSIDEVPDSSWFVNRIGQREMSLAELRRGTDRVDSISLDGWLVSGGKSGGVTPGFRMVDPNGQTFQIKFDPPANPEMSSSAEVIGAAFYHAFGYHTVEGYLARLDPNKLKIKPGATIYDPLSGKQRPFEMRDVRAVLAKSARNQDGTYRVLASRFADGKPLGNFRYYRTRPDDPNDLVPHEHRRELRGSRVFAAWLNHVDSRGINSLDMLVKEGTRAFVKHYMFDFGATLGSGTLAGQAHRVGNEYIFEQRPGWLTLASLGTYTRPWMHIHYPDVPPSVGRFEADAFRPELWKPEYPNPAFDNMRPDDAFWAARIVAKFSNEAIGVIVDRAHYSDPRAADYVTGTLVKRRDKVLAYWLTQVNPLVDFALTASGELSFANAAEQAGVATAASAYRVQWAWFDNATGAATNIGGEATVTGPRAQAPQALVDGGGTPGFIEIRVAAEHPQFPEWNRPVTLHFKRSGTEWKLVGLVRLPDESTPSLRFVKK